MTVGAGRAVRSDRPAPVLQERLLERDDAAAEALTDPLHEELVALELRHGRDDVLVAVEEQQVVDRRQIARVTMANVRQREC